MYWHCERSGSLLEDTLSSRYYGDRIRTSSDELILYSLSNHQIVTNGICCVVFLTNSIVETIRNCFVGKNLQQNTCFCRNIAKVRCSATLLVDADHLDAVLSITIVALTSLDTSCCSYECCNIGGLTIVSIIDTQISIKLTCERAVFVSKLQTWNLVVNLRSIVCPAFCGLISSNSTLLYIDIRQRGWEFRIA